MRRAAFRAPADKARATAPYRARAQTTVAARSAARREPAFRVAFRRENSVSGSCFARRPQTAAPRSAAPRGFAAVAISFVEARPIEGLALTQARHTTRVLFFDASAKLDPSTPRWREHFALMRALIHEYAAIRRLGRNAGSECLETRWRSMKCPRAEFTQSFSICRHARVCANSHGPRTDGCAFRGDEYGHASSTRRRLGGNMTP